MTQNRWPRVGDVMRFTGKNGWDHDQKAAREAFEVGALLTVTGCRVGLSSSTISFEESPGKSWNSVMFEFTEPEDVSRPGAFHSYTPRTVGEQLDKAYPWGYRSEDKEP